MGRSVALSRLSLLNVLGRRNVYFSSSLIQSCPGSSEPYLEQASHFSSVASDSSPSPSTSGPASIEKTALGSAAAARREYEKQTALLRKKYAAELAEKKKREQKDEEIVRARISELKADRLQLKKEKAAARAIEVEEENRILQAHLLKPILVWLMNKSMSDWSRVIEKFVWSTPLLPSFLSIAMGVYEAMLSV
ncbi:hypothetical protein AXG93_496s1060 [Marchantia polymorpha subsp. ruderalis]|uniref:Uncharacterized protein n=1 Tax=Marchantia polymorpha subsp. ruderalis TaxID=1480154 RepID=A0A176VR67_MARPO|nr:hypothetical protein AXG93_496s1060 [Marchantia polymorpha subsp. ruderalis]